MKYSTMTFNFIWPKTIFVEQLSVNLSLHQFTCNFLFTVSYPCSSCKKTARFDCIGLPDGTARCICTKYIYRKMKDVPTVCYFEKAKPRAFNFSFL